MGPSSFVLVALAASLCSLGSLSQALQALTVSGSVGIPQSTGDNTDRQNDVDGKHMLLSESFLEGSGHSAESRTLLELHNKNPFWKESDKSSNENHSGSEIILTTRSALSVYSSEASNQGADKAKYSVTGYTRSTGVSENVSLDIHNDSQKGEDHPRLPVQTSAFSLTADPSLLGLERPILNSFNGTSLLWEDMSRTLTFAWELHVFGSVSLFMLITVLAAVGMAGACFLPHILRDALMLTNSFLTMAGALRTVPLFIDPYGTRQILSHATLAALHNIPLHLLLWAQVVLALVTLGGFKVLPFPMKVQCSWMVGLLGISHCTTLFLSDLFSSALPPGFPLLLQSISLCWGVPFCLGILTRSLSRSQPLSRSAVPQWVPSKRTERLGKRVTAVCAFLGVLCCSLQMYSLLWIYGLLGSWRRFSWSWWLSQFWARILELAWGSSILFLGSWIFWRPSKSIVRGNHPQDRNNMARGEKKGLWHKFFAGTQKGPRKNPEKSLEDLMPNNLAKHNMSRDNARHDYKQAPSKLDYCSDPVSISTLDSQTTMMWQKVGERECVLSLIEFDMLPPSPINLRLSIDNALYHGQHVAGAVFTPPPPSWTQSMSIDGKSGPTTFPPAGYGWMLDTESISASLDHFQAKEPTQSVISTPDFNGRIRSPVAEPMGEQFSVGMPLGDLSDDDVTDL